MQENSNSFSDAVRLAQSPAGQALLALLREKNGRQLQQAMERAAAGDSAGAKQLLQPLLSDPEIRALLPQLGEKP